MFTKEEIIRKLSESPTIFVYEFIFSDRQNAYKYYLMNNQEMIEVKDETWQALINKKITGLINGEDQENKQALVDGLKTISLSEELRKQQISPPRLKIEEEVQRLAPFGLVRLGRLIDILGQ